MSNFFKFFKLLFLSFIFFIIQLSVANSLDGFFSGINFILFYLVYVFIFYDLKTSLIFGLLSGFLLDLFSFHFFGVYSFSIIITIFIANFLLLNFFTNKSIYSFLALGLFFCFFYYFISSFLIYLNYWGQDSYVWFNSVFFLNFFKELFFISLAILFSFYFLGIDSEKGKKIVWSK